MMVREVSLSSVKQALLRIACELRPALAVSDPPVTIGDRGNLPPVGATRRRLVLRPAENVCVCDPGFHWRAQCRMRVVDTFPDRCRLLLALRREPEFNFADACP